MPVFRNDLSMKLGELTDTSDLDKLVESFNTSLRSTLDKHAPVVKRQVTERPHQPWFNSEIANGKREKRRCERKWRHS